MRLLTRVVMRGLLFCFPVGANSLEQNKSDEPVNSIEVGVGLICNSEQHLALYGKDQKDQSAEAAIRLVNTEAANPNACLIGAVAFVRGKEGTAVPAPGGQMKITQITILAAQTPFGWQRVTGLVQFTAIFEKLDEA